MNTFPNMGRDNDCLETCVRALTGGTPPDLFAGTADAFEQDARLDDWLAGLGWRAVRLYLTGAVEPCDIVWQFGGCAIAWGRSPRREHGQHAVLVRAADGGLVLAHDPHHSRDGVVGPYTGIMWIIREVSRD